MGDDQSAMSADVLRIRARERLSTLVEEGRSTGRYIDERALSQAFHQDFEAVASTPACPTWDAPMSTLRVGLEVFSRIPRGELVGLEAAFSPSLQGTVEFRDLSGNCNAGRITGIASCEPFALGSHALILGDEGAGLTIAPSPSLDVGQGGSDFSVCLFTRLVGPADGQWRCLIHKGRSDQERTFAAWFRFDSNRLHARLSTDAYWNEGIESSLREFPLRRWVHMAYVKSANNLQLYLDGRLDTTTRIRGNVRSNPGPLYVGKSPWYPGCSAGIAELRVYPFALSEAAVLELATSKHSIASTDAREKYQEYVRQSYEALLRVNSTSYEELLNISLADDTTRQRFAARLFPAVKQHALLDRLSSATLSPASITESAINVSFGVQLWDPPGAQSGIMPDPPAPVLIDIDRATLPLLRSALLARMGGEALQENLIQEVRRNFGIDLSTAPASLTTRRQVAVSTLGWLVSTTTQAGPPAPWRELLCN
jgi:hypothetical protein